MNPFKLLSPLNPYGAIAQGGSALSDAAANVATNNPDYFSTSVDPFGYGLAAQIEKQRGQGPAKGDKLGEWLAKQYASGAKGFKSLLPPMGGPAPQFSQAPMPPPPQAAPTPAPPAPAAPPMAPPAAASPPAPAAPPSPSPQQPGWLPPQFGPAAPMMSGVPAAGGGGGFTRPVPTPDVEGLSHPHSPVAMAMAQAQMTPPPHGVGNPFAGFLNMLRAKLGGGGPSASGPTDFQRTYGG